MRVEEYYPTPVETAILRACQPELRQFVQPQRSSNVMLHFTPSR